MIVFDTVSKKYGNADSALEEVSFTIPQGEFVYLVGPTGSGKTTIFRLIIKDLLPSSGTVSLGEWNIGKLSKKHIPMLRRKVGVIFQDLKLLLDRTVVENVMLPLFFSGVNEKQAKLKAAEVLAEVGLGEALEKFPVQLSGGERQRVAIARALVFRPEILLADEPTGNLDIKTSLQIIDLLKAINKNGTTIFMATHNEQIIHPSDRVLVLDNGKVKEDKNSKKHQPASSGHKKEEHEDKDKKDKEEEKSK